VNETGAVLGPSARLEEAAPHLLAELLRRCGEARIRVAGTSMLPLIRPGDVLLVQADFSIVVKETALAKDAGDFDGDRIPIHVSLVMRHTSG